MKKREKKQSEKLIHFFQYLIKTKLSITQIIEWYSKQI